MANIYCEDAILHPPAKDLLYGKKAIFTFWSSLPKSTNELHKSVPDSFIVMGDIAYDFGYYAQSKKEDGTLLPLNSVKYFIILLKENGK